MTFTSNKKVSYRKQIAHLSQKKLTRVGGVQSYQISGQREVHSVNRKPAKKTKQIIIRGKHPARKRAYIRPKRPLQFCCTALKLSVTAEQRQILTDQSPHPVRRTVRFTERPRHFIHSLLKKTTSAVFSITGAIVGDGKCRTGNRQTQQAGKTTGPDAVVHNSTAFRSICRFQRCYLVCGFPAWAAFSVIPGQPTP